MGRPILLVFLLTASSSSLWPAAPGASGVPLWPNVCTPDDVSSAFPFCDASLTHKDRASDLVSRLTLEEKQSLLDNTALAIPRLGIPKYQWWSEGLHGPLEPCVNGTDSSGRQITKCPTSFPAASAMASAFNDTLYLLAGSVTGVEGRSISNLRVHDTAIGDGLTYWAPNANMERDPRWGRNMEAPGEDPHLSSQYIAHYVRGMQEGDDPNYVQIVATCKHFLANELEHSTINGKVVSRHNFDAEIPLPELRDYYLPAFEACVTEGRALGIMCSYNAVNGVPMCANERLLKDVLRRRWGFEGYVTSDCGAIKDIYDSHRFVPDGPTAAAAGLKAGCDSDCGGVYGENVVAAVKSSHALSEETVDASLRRLVNIQMKLGLFDRKDTQPYFDPSEYGIERVDAPAHRKLAYEAALQSVVLLKNDGPVPVLPLKKGSNVAVIGPHVESRVAFLSNYHGERCPDKSFDCVVSPLEAVVAANGDGGTVTHARGCEVNSDVDEIHDAVDAAARADAVILLVGIDGSVEGEEHDRDTCALPGLQAKLVEAIAALNKPTVMILIHGGALCLGELKDAVPSIVDAFYGGEYASSALAAVLFGDYNPTGKLPVTMYPPEYMTQNPITQMSVTAPPGRTHLYYSGTPEFAFGTGLSYSKWTVEVLSEPEEEELDASSGGVGRGGGVVKGTTAQYRVRLTNAGPAPGGQRVLAYARPVGGHIVASVVRGAPRQRLWSYRAVDTLDVGTSIEFTFDLDVVSNLAVSDDDGNRVVHPGEYEIAFSDGGDREGEAKAAAPLRIVGNPTIVEESIFGGGSGSGSGSGGDGTGGVESFS